MMRLDERIDAAHIGINLAPRLGCQPLPRTARRAAEPDGPEEAILWHGCRPENFGEPAVTDAALELHPPQAILRMDVAEAVERIEPGRGEHMRNTVGVADDLDGVADTGDHEGPVDERRDRRR